MSDDPELETFLKQFRPRPPAPLRRRRSVRPWWALAAAAGLMILAWWGRSQPAPPVPAHAVSSQPLPATLGAFRAAVRSGTYEGALEQLDVVLLPDPTLQGGALQVLADVNRDR